MAGKGKEKLIKDLEEVLENIKKAETAEDLVQMGIEEKLEEKLGDVKGYVKAVDNVLVDPLEEALEKKLGRDVPEWVVILLVVAGIAAYVYFV